MHIPDEFRTPEIVGCWMPQTARFSQRPRFKCCSGAWDDFGEGEALAFMRFGNTLVHHLPLPRPCTLYLSFWDPHAGWFSDGQKLTF